VVETAKALGMYKSKLLSVAAGRSITAICTVDGKLFTCGGGTDKDSGLGLGFGLGHGGGEDAQELSPRLVEALAGKKVVGVSVGDIHTAAWTDAGELFTFGAGYYGQLGHGGGEHAQELSPRLVEALAGKKVVGVSVGDIHTAAWTEAGELFTFGEGYYGKLGHGGEEGELLPRLVEALAGKIVVGASAGVCHTAVWNEAGELFTVGLGECGRLGHGGEENEYVPRLVESLVEAPLDA